MFSVLGAEAAKAHVARPSSSCSPLQNSSKLEIFGNFVASRSAGPFVGRHFLLERHFAGEMISVGKARRCPFKNSSNGYYYTSHMHPWAHLAKTSTSIFTAQSRRTRISHSLCMC